MGGGYHQLPTALAWLWTLEPILDQCVLAVLHLVEAKLARAAVVAAREVHTWRETVDLEVPERLHAFLDVLAGELIFVAGTLDAFHDQSGIEDSTRVEDGAGLLRVLGLADLFPVVAQPLVRLWIVGGMRRELEVVVSLGRRSCHLKIGLAAAPDKRVHLLAGEA